MKNLLFFIPILFFCIVSHSFAQWSTNGSSVYYNNGNVGIGTSNPLLPLHFSNGMQIGTSGTANQNFHFYSHSSGSDWGLHLYNGNNGSGTHLFVVKNNGSVGIGTNNPDNNYKLSINGKVRSKEVVVESGWSDFVFYDDYNLMSLADLEKFINQNKHLPEIPTEKEVNEKGIGIGEISSKLLQKIEELTLYIIDQNKKIEELEQRLSSIENN